MAGEESLLEALKMQAGMEDTEMEEDMEDMEGIQDEDSEEEQHLDHPLIWKVAALQPWTNATRLCLLTVQPHQISSRKSTESNLRKDVNGFAI